tara:strand:- start:118 stop:834 length:717 start_codon:yes stop_codon:yes gene_type:complete
MKTILITIVVGLLTTGMFADPIHDASAQGDLAGLIEELDKGVDPNIKSATNSAPPLHLAVLNAHIKIAKLLIKKGADLEGKDKFGNTSLHYTAKNGSKKIIAILIDQNVDVNAKNKAGETPLDIAANKETADFLIKNNGEYGTFIGAVAGGNIDAIKKFVNAGANVNQKVQHGWTPMHEAAIFGHTDVARLLIKKGANINAWDGYETPIDVSGDKSEFTKLLRKLGGKTGKELKDNGK